MQTKIKATAYAAKLRAKLAALKAQRPKDQEAYKKALLVWRADLKKWLAEQGPKRVDAAKPERTNRWGSSLARFDGSDFFAGAPVPPVAPDGKQIRDIQHLLRHLGLTGQETILVSTEDVARYLGDEKEE